MDKNNHRHRADTSSVRRLLVSPAVLCVLCLSSSSALALDCFDTNSVCANTGNLVAWCEGLDGTCMVHAGPQIEYCDVCECGEAIGDLQAYCGGFSETADSDRASAPLSFTPLTSTHSYCSDSCDYSYDGVCDDGGLGAEYSICTYGTDCSDCGSRSADGSAGSSGMSTQANPESCGPLSSAATRCPGSCSTADNPARWMVFLVCVLWLRLRWQRISQYRLEA